MIEYYAEHGNSVVDRTTEQEALLKTLNAGERLHWKILHRHKEGVEKDIDELLS